MTNSMTWIVTAAAALAVASFASVSSLTNGWMN